MKVTNAGEKQIALQQQITELQKLNGELHKQIALAEARYKVAAAALHQHNQSGGENDHDHQQEQHCIQSQGDNQPSNGRRIDCAMIRSKDTKADCTRNDEAHSEQVNTACMQRYEPRLAELEARCKQLQQENQQLKKQHGSIPECGKQARENNHQHGMKRESPVSIKLEELLQDSKVR